jgi:hypothetical protein
MALNENAVRRESYQVARDEETKAATIKNVTAFAPASLHTPSASVSAPSPKQ